ncbi:hypothetical protein CTAM01_12993 [Colletotrichum tamarilloi]|uniref:Uncharacterized protein n=2 Tax=Colletotrichum acutatum species complex TaxID=2707335 RepID=A0ABQ9QTB9_9PEZI|nr:uncharacterized protein CTAM01_12993 [Colletotrichum tamarilloi]KAK1484488.1 hypothetical protein CTAM01_12993 [Colletotrichum tamarilloi]
MLQVYPCLGCRCRCKGHLPVVTGSYLWLYNKEAGRRGREQDCRRRRRQKRAGRKERPRSRQSRQSRQRRKQQPEGRKEE